VTALDPLTQNTPLAALGFALQACERALVVPVARTSVFVGNPAWDDCCAGQLYGRVPLIASGELFPAPGLTAPECYKTRTVSLVIGLVRCTPGPTPEGAPPDAAAEAQASIGLYQEAEVINDTLNGEWWLWAHEVVQQVFSTQGGCIAVETTLAVQIL